MKTKAGCCLSILNSAPSFREPAVGIKQFDADTLLAIGRVRPDTIDFGFNSSTKGRREGNSVSEFNSRVRDDCRASATDFNGDGINMKLLTAGCVPFQHDRELNRNARAARAPQRHGGFALQFFIHQARLALSISSVADEFSVLEEEGAGLVYRMLRIIVSAG